MSAVVLDITPDGWLDPDGNVRLEIGTLEATPGAAHMRFKVLG